MSSPVDDICSHAIAYYHELLAGRHEEDLQQRLDDTVAANKMTWGGRRIARVLRPVFLSESSYEHVTESAAVIGRAIHKVIRRTAEDETLLDRFHLNDVYKALASMDANDPGPMGIHSRMDGFVQGDGRMRFIEHNPQPFGVVHPLTLTRMFDEHVIMREFRQRFNARHIDTMSYGMGRARAYHEELGGKGLPVFGYIPTAPEEQTFPPDYFHEGMTIMERVRSEGGVVQVGQPDEYHLIGDRLACNGVVIDIVYPDDLPTMLRIHGFDHPVFQALANKTVRLPGGFSRAILGGSKAAFAILSEPSELFDDGERKVIDEVIPWTRLVEDTRTTGFDGEAVDCLTFCADHREELVLKPTEGLGGRGIVLGWEVDDDEWAKAMVTAKDSELHVVQRRVDVPSAVFPMITDSGVSYQPLFYDTAPFVWGMREAAGLLSRLSATGILNITAGTGSISGVFIVSEQD